MPYKLPGEDWGYRQGLRFGNWFFPKLLQKLPDSVVLWLAKKMGITE